MFTKFKIFLCAVCSHQGKGGHHLLVWNCPIYSNWEPFLPPLLVFQGEFDLRASECVPTILLWPYCNMIIILKKVTLKLTAHLASLENRNIMGFNSKWLPQPSEVQVHKVVFEFLRELFKCYIHVLAIFLVLQKILQRENIFLGADSAPTDGLFVNDLMHKCVQAISSWRCHAQ